MVDAVVLAVEQRLGNAFRKGVLGYLEGGLVGCGVLDAETGMRGDGELAGKTLEFGDFVVDV